jgi:hypothetical protein
MSQPKKWRSSTIMAKAYWMIRREQIVNRLIPEMCKNFGEAQGQLPGQWTLIVREARIGIDRL